MNKTTLPVGTPVVVIRDTGLAEITKTRSMPWLMCGHSWVVLLDGISGCYSLSRVAPISENFEKANRITGK